MPALETVLRIRAEDDTAAAFASVAAKIDALQGQVNRVDKVSASVMAARVEAGGSGSFAAPGAALAEHAAAVDKTAAATQNLDNSATSMLGSALEFAAAAVGFKSLHDAFAQATDQAHENVRMKAAGMDESEVSEANAAAAEISRKYPSISESAAINMLRNMRSIVGSFSEASELAQDFARLRVVAKGADVKASEEQLNEEFDQLLKGIEIKGATQTESDFKTYMQGIAKGLNAFGDTLKPFEYYSAMKYGRQATPTLSDEFILSISPSLTQELRGSGFGKAVSAFNRAIVGNHLEHTSWKALADWGLVNPEDMDRTKTGEIKGIQPGKHIKDWEKAQADPYAWVRDDLVPALAAKGITDKAGITAAIGQIFDNQSASQLVDILATQQARIEKDRALLKGAMGGESAEMFGKEDPKIAGTGLWNTITNRLAEAVPADFFAHLMSAVSTNLNRDDRHFDLLSLISDFRGVLGPFDDPDRVRHEMQARQKGARDALAQRFPTEFGPGVDERDIQRLTKHRIEESKRYEDAERADPEAHRGAAMMGLSERNDIADAVSRAKFETMVAAARSEIAANLPGGSGAGGPVDVTGKVTLDPASKADVLVTVKADEGSLIQFITETVAHASGSLSASVGRMDSDAAPRRAAGFGGPR